MTCAQPVQQTTVIKLSLPQPGQRETAARRETARLWNDMVKLHRYIRKRHWPWPTQGAFEKHFKRRYSLHSQTVQALIAKFFANLDATRAKRKNGDRNARYPWRLKGYFNPVWKGQAVKRKGNRLTLPMGRGRKPLRVKIPKRFPDLPIAQVELGFRELIITVKRDAEPPVRLPNQGAGDPGIIRLITVTDGEETLSVGGRLLRSEVQRHNKVKAEVSSLRAKCKKGSRRWRRLSRTLGKSARRLENVTRNTLHHAANQVRDFCRERQIGELAVGDITEIARGKSGKRSKRHNQDISHVPMGRFYDYLRYKLIPIGCSLTLIDEAYTTQTCPVCGHRHKPAGRLYVCKCCGFTGVRDEVGAMNILCKAVEGKIAPGRFVPQGNIKYRRPVRGKAPPERRRCADARLGVPSPVLPAITAPARKGASDDAQAPGAVPSVVAA